MGEQGVPEEEGSRKSEPLTRKDMALVVAVLTVISCVVGLAGNWLFYSRTEGVRLEERFNAKKDNDTETIKRLNQLADAVNAVQINNVRLSELNIKLSERLDAIERIDRKDK